MTKVSRPYSRVYWEAIDDPKFAHVWDDDHALSAWLRLLVAADMAWPSSATLYHGVRKQAIQELVSAGLVDMQAGGRYRIHGLDAERKRRSAVAANASARRWNGNADGMRTHPPSNADGMQSHPNGNAEGMPRRDKEEKENRYTVPPGLVDASARLAGRSTR